MRGEAAFGAAAAHGAAVFVHCGVLTVGVAQEAPAAAPFDSGSAIRCGRGAGAPLPRVPVIIPHFGAGFFREALMAADQAPNVHLDTSSSNGWISYHAGQTLEAVFRQAVDRRRRPTPALRHRFVVLPARLAAPVYDAQARRSTRLASACGRGASSAATSIGCFRMSMQSKAVARNRPARVSGRRCHARRRAACSRRRPPRPRAHQRPDRDRGRCAGRRPRRSRSQAIASRAR